MTGRKLIELTRTLLGDSGRRASTASRFYSAEEVRQHVNMAQESGALALILLQRTADGPKRGGLTVSRLVKETTGTSGTAVPDDFWLLECGFDVASKYVKACPVDEGERYRYIGEPRVFVSAGTFQGSATTAVYWSKPVELQDTTSTLTTFPDAFYHAIKYLAAAKLLVKEQHDQMERAELFQTEFSNALTSLQ